MQEDKPINLPEQKNIIRKDFRLYGKGVFYSLIIVFLLLISFAFLNIASLDMVDEQEQDKISSIFAFFLFANYFLFLYAGATLTHRAWKQLLIFEPKNLQLGPKMRAFLLFLFGGFVFYWVFYSWFKIYQQARTKASQKLPPLSKKLFLFVAWFLPLALLVGFIATIGDSFFNFAEFSDFMNSIFTFLAIAFGAFFLIWILATLVLMYKIVKITDLLCLQNYN